jgi:hypothetical protein
LDFDRWEVFKSNTLKYPKNDNNRLEVKDKQSNIVLTIQFDKRVKNLNVLEICGYFISPTAISVVQMATDSNKTNLVDTCLLKNNDNAWKQNAEVVIQHIQPIFN